MRLTVTEHPSVEMLRQLGGQRFVAMTGAKDFMSADNPQPRLIFRLPANMTNERGTHFEISLLPSDTYLCVFFKMRKGERNIIDRGEYMVEDLQAAFTSMTGLDTHL